MSSLPTPRLSVNLNRVALLRNSRTTTYPSVSRAADTVITAGAQGITVHPRPDERHIRAADVLDLGRVVAEHPHVELNIEGNPFAGLLDHVGRVKPTQCTLVPDAPDATTSDHGWDLAASPRELATVIADLRGARVRTSLFVDADPEQVTRAADLGADRVELYTGPFARAFEEGGPERSLPAYTAAAERARALGLGVNAGHDLSLRNLPSLLAAIPFLAEVSIGHALIADALDMGLAETVRRYLYALRSPVIGHAPYRVTTDPAAIDFEVVYRFLSQSYWAAGIPRETLRRSIAGSLCFSALYEEQAQVGFARVVTDRATFAYLADVFVTPEHRRRGVSAMLMQAIIAHPELQGLRRWVLVTRDAQGLYDRYGFRPLATPDRYMERWDPQVYTRELSPAE